MRSKEIQKWMLLGSWTVGRIYDRLETGSKEYLKQVIYGQLCPSKEFASVIRSIIVPPNELKNVRIESLFPLLSNSGDRYSRRGNGIIDDSYSPKDQSYHHRFEPKTIHIQ